MHLEIKELNQLIGGRPTNRQDDSFHILCYLVAQTKQEQQKGINEIRTLTGLSK